MIIGLYGALIGISIGMTLMAVIFYCIDDRLTAKTERVKELAKADGEGRVIILPYKIGDTVYVSALRIVVQLKVHEIRFKPMPVIYVTWDDDEEGLRCLTMDPQNVFKTRKEAEKALEAMKNAD